MLGSLEAVWVLHWQRHWWHLWPSVGSDSGNCPAPEVASMLYLLGHPGFPQTLAPEARLPWGGGMQAWRTEALCHEGR